jgi:hypothetical protein
MVWAVDRLGRSVPDLLSTMQDFTGRGSTCSCTSYAIREGDVSDVRRVQRIRTRHDPIQSRVKAGLARAKAEQQAGIVRRGPDGRKKKAIGRPKIRTV